MVVINVGLVITGLINAVLVKICNQYKRGRTPRIQGREMDEIL
jgi:hypothetical protein